MCALLPSPSSPFVPCLSSSSLLWLAVSLQLHLFVSHSGIEIRPSYHYQHPKSAVAEWASTLGGWEGLHSTRTDSDTRDRDPDAHAHAHVVLPQVFLLRVSIALVLAFCGHVLLPLLSVLEFCRRLNEWRAREGGRVHPRIVGLNWRKAWRACSGWGNCVMEESLHV
jgi:hypothetical protein